MQRQSADEQPREHVVELDAVRNVQAGEVAAQVDHGRVLAPVGLRNGVGGEQKVERRRVRQYDGLRLPRRVKDLIDTARPGGVAAARRGRRRRGVGVPALNNRAVLLDVLCEEGVKFGQVGRVRGQAGPCG